MIDMTMCTAKVIEHSISPDGIELFSLQLRYPRFIHAEVKTHRVLSVNGEEYALTQDAAFMSDRNLSRNASSSRAIPVAKMIEQVRNDPAMPVHWGKNQPGMQANEQLTGVDLDVAKSAWRRAAWQAANIAEEMQALGLHKQVANRILEPFQFISVIVTATEWDGFFKLRAHPDAQPEIHALANAMSDAMANSQAKLLKPGEWHLPYVSAEERAQHPIELLCKLSAARCARVSYLTHDNQQPDIDKDVALFERLVGSTPLHASPIEHQATPDELGRQVADSDGADFCDWNHSALHGNFKGWKQYRKLFEAASLENLG